MTDLEVAEEISRSVVDIHGLQEVGIPIRQVGEHARVVVKVTKAAICATRDAHTIP